MTDSQLRTLIGESLRSQGFIVEDGRVSLPATVTKEDLRCLHAQAVQHRIAKAREGLQRFEPALLQRLATGARLEPARITPRLVEVRSGSPDELLFRYASLHWSIPVSSGYGRRLRFLVIDNHNDKLIGLIGLGDPVYSLGVRDQWIGWAPAMRRRRLQNVMDAFVLGAVPPYSMLLAGKLVALLTASNEVRAAFRRKYRGSRSLIRRATVDGRLSLITTSSALGRSSIYNRLRYERAFLFQSVGFTKGSGDFHFSNGLYSVIADYARRHCAPTAKERRWGSGFRNRREVIKKCLSRLGLSSEWIYHGVQREVFVAPLAENTIEFLRGDHSRLVWRDYPADALAEYFKHRWLIPRSLSDHRYRTWRPDEWQLWVSPASPGGTDTQKLATSPRQEEDTSQIIPI